MCKTRKASREVEVGGWAGDGGGGGTHSKQDLPMKGAPSVQGALGTGWDGIRGGVPGLCYQDPYSYVSRPRRIGIVQCRFFGFCA